MAGRTRSLCGSLRTVGTRPVAGKCGEKAKYRDKRRERRYRHVPLWGIPVTLVYTLRRVRCKRCGLRVEAVP